MKENVICCIDLKSFYASVECIDRGLDPFTTPLVVADCSRGKGTIVLAVSPYLKTLGIPSRLRIYDLPKDIPIIYAKPRMSRYIERSSQIISLFLEFVMDKDLHVYSVDESFLDLTPYLDLYKKTPLELVQEILNRIKNQFGLAATAGIGPNLFLAKASMDIEAKHNSSQIAYWTLKDVPNKLYPVTPLSKVWGIGQRLERRLNALGYYKIEDIALTSKNLLIQQFGIIGEELYQHAHGIDEAKIQEIVIPEDPSISIGQVLLRDYEVKEMKTVIREMCDDICLRLLLANKVCKSIALGIGYSKETSGGFYHQTQLNIHTSNPNEIYHAFEFLFDKYIENYPIRRVSLRLSKLKENTYFQTNLLVDIKEQEKEEKLLKTIAEIKKKFGSNSILRLDSLSKSSTTRERHEKIGGHAR